MAAILDTSFDFRAKTDKPAAAAPKEAAAEATVAGSLSYVLHPLVVINISDHHTRVCAQNQASERIFGVLLGEQSGRRVEIANSFEIKVSVNGDSPTCDPPHRLTTCAIPHPPRPPPLQSAPPLNPRHPQRARSGRRLRAREGVPGDSP